MYSIEANQMEDRAMNKMWLVRHLEVTRQLVLEDLRVVKVEHPPCWHVCYLFIVVYYTVCALHAIECTSVHVV